MSSTTLALSKNESAFLQHWMRWGSQGYPIQRVGRGWLWTEMFGIKGSPIVYKTKRAVTEAIETYIGTLIDRKAGR